MPASFAKRQPVFASNRPSEFVETARRIQDEYDTLFPVTWCEVVFSGSDRKEYRQLVEAGSLYDAAAHALDQVGKLWWFDPNSPFVVRVLQQSKEYKLTPRQVHSWTQRRQQGGKRAGGSRT